MAEEIRNTEELKKAEESAAQDAQKLDDETLEKVAGGRADFGSYQSSFESSGSSKSSAADANVFAMEIAPKILGLCAMVKAGEDRNKVWGQNCLHIRDLIDIYLPSGTQFNIVYAKEWFEVCCTVV